MVLTSICLTLQLYYMQGIVTDKSGFGGAVVMSTKKDREVFNIHTPVDRLIIAILIG